MRQLKSVFKDFHFNINRKIYEITVKGNYLFFRGWRY